MGLTTTMPSPLDEYPVHQTPLPMDRVATSDRNFYDRCYINLHDPSGEVFMVTGLGVYPNLGVIDAYAAARTDDEIRSVRFSDALGDRSLDQQVGATGSTSPSLSRSLTCTASPPTAALTSTCTGPRRSPRCRRNRTCCWPAAARSWTPPGSARWAAGAGS
jgi:hypothetical protein